LVRGLGKHINAMHASSKPIGSSWEVDRPTVSYPSVNSIELVSELAPSW
jgi:hypothetical protein